VRRANGTGSVYKLSGNRRKPWVAVSSSVIDGTKKQEKKILGYFKKETDAKMVLDAYNVGAYEVPDKIKLQEVYDEWFAQKERKVKSMHAYKFAWNYLSSLKGMKFADIRLVHLQNIVDAASDDGLSYNSIVSIKSLMSQLYKHSMKNDIVNKDYSKFVELPKRDSKAKVRFTDMEIKKLVKLAKSDPYVNPILIMIYTGLRITELMELTRFNIDIEGMIITGGIKTDAGRDRIIPIHPKIQEYIRYWYDQGGESLILTKRGQPMKSTNYRDNYFNKIIEANGFRKELTPHSCRHTFASMLASAGADTLHIQKLIGHSDYSMTANVYTHPDVEELKKAIGKMI
jgi:site-specific recombinase XerD